MNRLLLAVLVTVTLIGTVSLRAHYEFRIVGTVVKLTAAQIDVKQIKDGKIVEIDVDQKTKVTKDKKPAAYAQIKVGASVVVEALGDSILDLAAIEIRLVPAIPQPAAKPTAGNPAVVFVCEHGAAKSLIATAYFNKLAAERGLPYRATFRGVNPQEALSVRALEGLKADGVPVPAGAPTAIGAADVEKATHIFAIGCTLPAAAAESGKAKDWSDVPEDKGYEGTRDAIVKHVKELLDDLQRRGK